jgi:hypothetical protein
MQDRNLASNPIGARRKGDPTRRWPAIGRGSCRMAPPDVAAIRLRHARLHALQRKRDDETEFAKFQEEKAEMSRKKDEAARLQQAACSMQHSTRNIRHETCNR